MSKALLRVSETAEQIGFGRTKTYELIRRGLIRAVRVDGSLRVPAAAIEAFVDNLVADQEGQDDRARDE